METIASFNSPVVFLNSSISDSFPKFINFHTSKNNVSHFSIKVIKNGTVRALKMALKMALKNFSQ